MHNADPDQKGAMAAISGIHLDTIQNICEQVSTIERPACVACMPATSSLSFRDIGTL